MLLSTFKYGVLIFMVETEIYRLSVRVTGIGLLELNCHHTYIREAIINVLCAYSH